MPKETKESVIAFRVPPGKHADLSDALDKSSIPGVDSANKMARKVLLDFLGGKLVYLRREDINRPPAV